MFKPWIGSEYPSRSPKVLILGESHYGNAHLEHGYALEDKTLLCIRDQIDDTWKHAYYTKVVSTVIGHRPTLEDKREFWNSVAYHNLITEPLERSRKAPSEEQWINSIKTLPQFMDDLKPDYCLCMGVRMWQRLSVAYDLTTHSTQSEAGECGVKSSNVFGCYFHGIKHPSSFGYSYGIWGNHVRSVINELYG